MKQKRHPGGWRGGDDRGAHDHYRPGNEGALCECKGGKPPPGLWRRLRLGPRALPRPAPLGPTPGGIPVQRLQISHDRCTGPGDVLSAGSSGSDGEAPTAGDGPRRIVVAGDWHGNEEWAVSVIRRVPTLLAAESQRLILHLGDFGIWPDKAGLVYLDQVSKVLAEVDAELWV